MLQRPLERLAGEVQPLLLRQRDTEVVVRVRVARVERDRDGQGAHRIVETSLPG